MRHIHDNASRYQCDRPLLAGRASPFARTITIIWQPIRVQTICLFRVSEGIVGEAHFEDSHAAFQSCRNCTCVNCSCLLWISETLSTLPSPPLPSPPLPLPSPPLPLPSPPPSFPLVTQRIHSPFQPRQSPSLINYDMR